MHHRTRKVLSATAAGGLLFAGTSGTAFAAHDSKGHDQHERIMQDDHPASFGWDQMGSNPSDMTGMMESPPMHDKEHPGMGPEGTGDQPTVSEEVQEVDRTP